LDYNNIVLHCELTLFKNAACGLSTLLC